MSPHVHFPSMSTAALAHGDTVFIRALYPLGVLSANIYTGWILFMPLLKVVQNDISHADASEVRTTTISETFGTFNVIVTVMIIGPLSVIFVVRAHRTLCLRVLSERQRRIIFLVLIAAQYTLFVVLRYDALQGPVHYAFTGATFLLLYSYHISTTFVRVVGPALFKAKLIAGVTSATCIFCFLCFIVLWRVDEAPTLPWTATCLCEVLGAIALAALDITDLYVLRVSYDPGARPRVGGASPRVLARHAPLPVLFRRRGCRLVFRVGPVGPAPRLPHAKRRALAAQCHHDLAHF